MHMVSPGQVVNPRYQMAREGESQDEVKTI